MAGEQSHRRQPRPAHRDRQAKRRHEGLRRPAPPMGRDRLYNVAKSSFDWSSFIERRGGRRQPLLIPVSPDRHTSQFVTGDSKSSRDLMRQRRPVRGPVADGGADGPAHGSPPAASARIVRSDKVRPTASDRGLRPSCDDGTAREPAIEARRRAASQDKDGDSGGIGR